MAVSLPGGKKSREAWHLLGLLAGAKGKDWGNGLLVLETALDDEVEEDEQVEESLQSTANGNGTDLNGIDARLAHLDEPVSTISGLSTFEYFRDQTEQLEAEVQLRITKNVVIEVMEGPEAALLDQQSLLAYFSAAFANIKDVPGEPQRFSSFSIAKADDNWRSQNLPRRHHRLSTFLRSTSPPLRSRRAIRFLVGHGVFDTASPLTLLVRCFVPVISSIALRHSSLLSIRPSHLFKPLLYQRRWISAVSRH